MATQDWPTDRAFVGAMFRPGVDVQKSGFTGFYTGNRETVSHLSDRMTCEVSLPPCKNRADAARREAFFMGLVSTGDWVRFGMTHRAQPIGTMRGSPTVNGAVAAGARSVVLAGVNAGQNLLLGGSFEVDSNADGLANAWSSYSSGTTGTVSYVRGGGAVDGSFRQRIQASGLGTTSADRVGIQQSFPAPAVGSVCTFSAYCIADAAGVHNATLNVSWLDSGGSQISAGATTFSPSASAMVRHSISSQVPSGCVNVRVFLWVEQRVGVPGAAALEVDAAQFEVSSAATAYAGLATAGPGDFIGIGGNLLQVAYAGATATDAGAMTVPLVYPAPKAISNGAAVTLLNPTGTWELDTDGLQLDYTAGIIQGGIAVPFRQVPV